MLDNKSNNYLYFIFYPLSLLYQTALFIRNNYTETLNILQANIMNKINNKKYKKLEKKFLEDALMTSIAGISAAMKNTG